MYACSGESRLAGIVVIDIDWQEASEEVSDLAKASFSNLGFNSLYYFHLQGGLRTWDPERP